MNLFNFFSRITCLTMGGAEQAEAEAEFATVGLKADFFQAIPSIGPHQSFNLSTWQVMSDFYNDPHAHNLLFLEDDVQFRNLELLPAVLRELPKDFDVFFLGCNLVQSELKPNPRKVSKYVYKVDMALTTHAVCYTKPIVKYILDNHPGESERMTDDWQGKEVLKQFKAYTCKPMLAYQRPRLSRIWGSHVDYTEIFKNSEKICV